MQDAATATEQAAFGCALTNTGNALSNLNLGVFHPGKWFEGCTATLSTMLAIDLASYLAHRLLHAWTPLWEVHALHHSAEQLTPMTTYRQHPVELLVLNGTRGLFAGVALALVHSVFPNKTPVITILGLGAGFFVYMLTVNLHHFPAAVKYPRWMRSVLVSPHIHHLHHSRAARHRNKNFGVVFSFWDIGFGTYCDDESALDELKFGLEDLPASATTAGLGLGLFLFVFLFCPGPAL